MSENTYPEIIWESTVNNGAWRVVVESIPNISYRGILKISDNRTGALGYQEEVPINFDVRFGPDTIDLANWGAIAFSWIDAQ